MQSRIKRTQRDYRVELPGALPGCLSERQRVEQVQALARHERMRQPRVGARKRHT